MTEGFSPISSPLMIFLVVMAGLCFIGALIGVQRAYRLRHAEKYSATTILLFCSALLMIFVDLGLGAVMFVCAFANHAEEKFKSLNVRLKAIEEKVGMDR